MSSNIIIVGNGSSLLHTPNGTIIDSYDNVARFNAFDIENYKLFVGSKTTIWFNVINFQDKSNWRLFLPYKQIFLHSWQWDQTKDKLYIDFKEWYEKNAPTIPIIKTKKQTTIEIAEYADDSKYMTFSTGLIAIWEMIKINGSVDITGFDWWSTEKHHYNDSAARGTLHKPQLEKIIIDKLVADNKVFIV